GWRRMAGAGRSSEDGLPGGTELVANPGAVIAGVGAGSALDVRAGGDDFRLHAPARRGAAAGEADHVHGVVGACRADQAAIGPVAVFVRGALVLRSADGDHVLPITRRAHSSRTGARVAGGEDEDHLLVTGLVRIRVAHTGVKGLRGVIVRAGAAGAAPRVAADLGAAVLDALDQAGIRVAAAGQADAGSKDAGSGKTTKRVNAQPALVTQAIHIGEARGGVVPTGDTDVDVPMPVRPAAVRGAGAVGDIAEAGRVGDYAELMQRGVAGVDGAVADTGVGDVDDGIISRIGAEAVARQPGQIAGAGRAGAIGVEVAGDDLPLHFVEPLTLHPFFNPVNVGQIGNRVYVCQAHGEVRIPEVQHRRPTRQLVLCQVLEGDLAALLALVRHHLHHDVDCRIQICCGVLPVRKGWADFQVHLKLSIVLQEID